MSTENFLREIDESLVKFTKFFQREGFYKEKELKCIMLPEDLSVILHGEKVTLAERRQLEEALKKLKLKDSKKTGNIHIEYIKYMPCYINYYLLRNCLIPLIY